MKSSRRRGVSAPMLSVLAAVALAAGAAPLAQQRSQESESGTSGLEVLQVRQNVYMIAGAGANITMQIGGDGAVVVDAGTLRGPMR